MPPTQGLLPYKCAAGHLHAERLGTIMRALGVTNISESSYHVHPSLHASHIDP